MRLLYLNHNVAFSGTFQRAFHLAREMVARGHDVTLVTTSRSARVRAKWSERAGVRLLESPDLLWGPARTGWDPYNVARRIGALAGSSFDAVHAFDSRPAVIFPALAAARAGATLFMDWADWWGRGGTIAERSGPLMQALFGPVETWFEEAFRTRAAAATVISSALRERCVALGVPAERVLQIPNGCAPPVDDGPTRASARANLRLDDAPTIVHLGTAHPGDLALLYEAVRRARGEVPRLRLLMVGGFRGAPPADLVREGAIRATGFVAADALPLWLAAADACVVALRDTVANRGRWPGKVNDYFTAARATVITDVGEAALWVRKAGAGIVAAPEARALAAAIVMAVRGVAVDAAASALSDLRNGWSRAAAEAAARNLAAGELAWTGIADRLAAFYAALLPARVEEVPVSA
jgi:glycosyltransferase involved in cell wall biosynthesis